MCKDQILEFCMKWMHVESKTLALRYAHFLLSRHLFRRTLTPCPDNVEFYKKALGLISEQERGWSNADFIEGKAVQLPEHFIQRYVKFFANINQVRTVAARATIYKGREILNVLHSFFDSLIPKVWLFAISLTSRSYLPQPLSLTMKNFVPEAIPCVPIGLTS